jgi:uncharacterized membrane protein YGL010W
MTTRETAAGLDELLEDYDRDHQHPLNRALHMLGITLIGTSVALLLVAPLVAFGLGVLGWAAQLLGHWIEGKPPSFTRDRRYMAVGAMWYWRQVTGFVRSRAAHAP